MATAKDHIKIREMDIDDLADVFHLGEKLFTSEQYPSLYRTWDEWEVTGMFNTDPDFCLVAERGDETVGFVLGTTLEKGAWTYGYIIWLGVSPTVQRRGIADRLVDRLIEVMIGEGVRIVFCDTDPHNAPAMRFFTRKGFANPREHVYLTMNLERHPSYKGKVKAERRRPAARPRTHRTPDLGPDSNGAGDAAHSADDASQLTPKRVRRAKPRQT